MFKSALEIEYFFFQNNLKPIIILDKTPESSGYGFKFLGFCDISHRNL